MGISDALNINFSDRLGGLTFEQDAEGNWGYKPEGADTVTPFKKIPQFTSVVYAENVKLGIIEIPVDGVALIKFVTTTHANVSGYLACIHIAQTDDVINCIDIGNTGGITEDGIVCHYGYLPVLGLRGTKCF